MSSHLDGNMKITAVIFDMDGVLVESEPLHRRAELIVYEREGIPMTYGTLEQYAGIPDRVTFQTVLREHSHPEERADAMVEEKYASAMPRILREHGLREVDGAATTVRATAKHLPCALASSSPHRFIDLVVEALGLGQELAIRVSSEDVPPGRGKPEPDIFLLTAERMGVAPLSCLVIEDTLAGVTAAKAAGMVCFGLQNRSSGTQDLSGADWIIESMREVLPILEENA